MNLRQAVGVCIGVLRRRRGLTQEALAVEIDRTSAQVSLVERGRVAPSIDTLERISKALGVPPGRLLPQCEDGLSKDRLRDLTRIQDAAESLDKRDLSMAVHIITTIAAGRPSDPLTRAQRDIGLLKDIALILSGTAKPPLR